MIAVTDHNSAENAPAVIAAARDRAVTVLAGMEVTTAEEAHVLGLFPTLAAAMAMQAVVYDHLQPGENDEELFGLQVVANAEDEVEGMNPRLLSGATDLDVDQVVAAIHDQGGLAIACHIDREAYSLVGQLGFIPPDLALDAVEISARLTLPAARERFAEYAARPFVTASDAHDLEQLGRSPCRLRVAAPSFDELGRALAQRDGRAVLELEA